MRLLLPAFIVLLVTACGTDAAPTDSSQRSRLLRERPAKARRLQSTPVNPCAPTREHLDSDYTPGGLYAPGVADSGPATAIDVSGVLEPVPRDEPRSRYGNRSPYTVLGKSYQVRDSAAGYSERGMASWYGTKFHGRATSSGELYDMCLFTAAHKTLPLPSYVRVTNLDNGRSLIVRVNDRGPFHSGRIIDLSYAAAVHLGVDRTGTARVEVQAIDGDGERQRRRFRLRKKPELSSKAPNGPCRSAAFGEKANAQRLADRLQRAGIDDVDMDQAQVDGQHVWRVRIGPVGAGKLPEPAGATARTGPAKIREFSAE